MSIEQASSDPSTITSKQASDTYFEERRGESYTEPGRDVQGSGEATTTKGEGGSVRSARTPAIGKLTSLLPFPQHLRVT